jgi:hypothetical protein
LSLFSLLLTAFTFNLIYNSFISEHLYGLIAIYVLSLLLIGIFGLSIARSSAFYAVRI